MLEGPARYLPQVALATFLVVGLPAVAVSGAQRLVHIGALTGILLAVALSIAFSRLGAAVWMRHPGSRDVVFGDLMVWGWLRRMRAEGRLAEAERLLGDRALSAGRRAELLKALAANLEARDPYTAGHSHRVARLAEAIARDMGLSREVVAKVRTAAAVHDVGKIRTPRAILTKPARLTDSERAVMEEHAREGADMVAELGDPEITAMVEFHHERLDGSGYPDGLAGGDVPLGARIIAVADVFDAITSSRPYRPAQAHKRAMDALAADSPKRLDPRVVAAFRRHYSGERAVPASAFLAAAPQRFGTWLGGVLQGEGALPLAQGLSALAAAALMGGVTIGSPASESGGSAQRAGVDRLAIGAPAAPLTLVDAVTAPADATPGSGRGGGRPNGEGGREPGAVRGVPGGGGPGGGTGGGGTDGGGGDASPAQPGGGSQQPPVGPVRPAPTSPVQPTVTLAPDELKLGTNVTPPPVGPVQLPSADANVTIKLPLP